MKNVAKFFIWLIINSEIILEAYWQPYYESHPIVTWYISPLIYIFLNVLRSILKCSLWRHYTVSSKLTPRYCRALLLLWKALHFLCHFLLCSCWCSAEVGKLHLVGAKSDPPPDFVSKVYWNVALSIHLHTACYFTPQRRTDIKACKGESIY